MSARRTSRHARHVPHGRAAGSATVQSRPAARSSASVVLPTPAGPTSSTAWGAPPRIIDVDRTRARPRAPGSGRHPRRAVRRSRPRPARPRPCGSSGASARRPEPPRRPRRSGPCRRRRPSPPCGSSGASARRPEPPRSRPRRSSHPRSASRALRVVRRFGAAAGASASAAASAAAVVASILRAGAALRVVRRFGAAAGASASIEPSTDGRSAPRSGVTGRLLGDLGPEHGLELRRDLAPRLARRARRGGASRGRSSRGVPSRSRRGAGDASPATGPLALPPCVALAALAGPAADVRIAVDAATTAAAVALAVHGRLVGRATAASPATALATAATAARRGRATPLLGDEVLGDLGLVEVLVVGERGRGSRPAARTASPAANPRPSRTGSCAGRAVRRRRGSSSSSSSSTSSTSKASTLAGGRAHRGHLVTATASATTAATTAAAAALAIALGLGLALDWARSAAAASSRRSPRRRSAPASPAHARRIEVVEREDLGGREIGLGQAADLDRRSPGRRGRHRLRRCRRHCSTRRRSRPRPRPRDGDGHGLGLGPATSATTATAAAAGAGALGLLVRHLGHRQVVAVGDAPSGARCPSRRGRAG